MFGGANDGFLVEIKHTIVTIAHIILKANKVCFNFNPLQEMCFKQGIFSILFRCMVRVLI